MKWSIFLPFQIPSNQTLFLLEITGLLTAVHKDYFRVINYRELHFNDCGDRVAQLLHVELVTPASQCRNNDPCQEILIVNTHLLFPHDSSLCIVRLHQVIHPFLLNLNFFINTFSYPCYILILLTGLQNLAVCRILSEGI